MTDVIHAPFTAAQVDGLNGYQTAGWMHPFTCAYRDTPPHEGREAELVATVRGWVCRYCDYTQEWAHAFMVGPSYSS